MNELPNASQSLNQKMRAADESIVQRQTGVAGNAGYYRISALEEMEKQAAHNAEQLQLKSRGIDFLRDNPAFNEFITLIRTGSISI
jgi:hypothetical protein